MKGWSRVHAVAECTECDWVYTDIDLGLFGHKHKLGVEAQRHADETGHEVHGEISFIKDFNRKKNIEKKE